MIINYISKLFSFTAEGNEFKASEQSPEVT